MLLKIFEITTYAVSRKTDRALSTAQSHRRISGRCNPIALCYRKLNNCVKIDYNTCGLRKPTCVICNKYSYISNSDVTTVIGALSAADYRNVISELCKPENNVVKFEKWRDLVR